MAVNWLKKGKEAHKQVEQADAETAKKQAAGLARRFWIPNDTESQITFLDGGLDTDGLLQTVTYWEHQLRMNGHWRNWFACTQDQEPCPICLGQADTPSLVAVFTVLDHNEWKDKQGAMHKNERRLFVCKRETFKRLQKIATKREGLSGATFDVSRTGDKSASVGSDFDFVEKRIEAEIRKAYSLTKDDVAAFDYEEVIVYRDASELQKIGFGAVPVGGIDVAGNGAGVTQPDYSKDL